MPLLPALLWTAQLMIGSPTGLPVASKAKPAVDGPMKANAGLRAADATSGDAGKPRGDGKDTVLTGSEQALKDTIARLSPPAPMQAPNTTQAPTEVPAKAKAPPTTTGRTERTEATTTSGTTAKPEAAQKPDSSKETTEELRAWSTPETSPYRGAPSGSTAELLSLVAEIAVRRAKRNGLAYLQEVVTDGVCRLKQDRLPLLPSTCGVLKGTSLERLAGDPETLMVALASDLFVVIDPTKNSRLNGGMRTLVTGCVALVARVASTRGGRFGAQDTREITELLLRQAEQYNESNIAEHRGVAVGLGAGAVMVAGFLEGSTLSAVSVITALEAETAALTPEQWAEALTLAGLVYRAAGGDSEGGPDAARVQVVAGLQAMFLVLNSVASCESDACTDYRAALEGITLGAAERNVPRVLSSSVKFLVRLISKTAPVLADLPAAVDHARTEVKANWDGKTVVSGKVVVEEEQATRAIALAAEVATQARHIRALKSAGDAVKAAIERLQRVRTPTAVAMLSEKMDELARVVKTYAESKVALAVTAKMTAERAHLEKLITVLAALAAYAETHDPAKTEGKSAEELRKARKEVLEGVIDAVTVRSGRGGKWVGSLGVAVGFTAIAGQWTRGTDGGLNRGTVIAPQLALPLGVAVQLLPGRPSSEARAGQRFFANGLHFFLSAMDLGQFLAYDGQGKLSPPTWSSFIAPGAQVAWALGRPNNMLLIGAEARYAPTLFSSLSNSDGPGKVGGALRFGLFIAYYIPLLDFN